MEDYESDMDDLFEEDPFVDDDFVDNSPIEDSHFEFSVDERQALKRGRENYSNIIDKYICLSHGLPSPAFTARHASKILLVNEPVKKQIFVDESTKIGSNEKITSQDSLKNDSNVECEDPIQEEIEKTLLKRKRELGLSEDYVLEEIDLNDEIDVNNIGLEENENYEIPLKKSERLEIKSRLKKIKNVRNEGNLEKFNRFKEKRTPGRPRKSAIQGELQGKDINRRLEESIALGIKRNKTKTPGRPKKFHKKSPRRPKVLIKKNTLGRPIKSPRNTPGRPKKFLQNTPGRPKKYLQNTPGRPKKFLQNTPGRPKRFLPNTPGRTKRFPQNTPGKLKESPISKIGKQEAETKGKETRGRPKTPIISKKEKQEGEAKFKETRGRPRKTSISKIGKQEGEATFKETRGRPKKASISKIGKQEGEAKSKETRGRPKKASISKIGKGECYGKAKQTRGMLIEATKSKLGRQEGDTKAKETRGRPRKTTSSKIYKDRRKELTDETKESTKGIMFGKAEALKRLNKSKSKSFVNSKAVLHKSISRYFKYLSTTFGISKEQGHLALSKSLDLTVVPPLKKGCCPDMRSFCLPNEVRFAIPFMSETSVLEKDKGLGVQTNAKFVKIAKRDCTWRDTSRSAIDFLSNDCLTKETQNKENITNGRSKLENPSCHPSKRIHSEIVENLVSCKQVLEKSQTEMGRGDLHSVGDYERQLQDNEPQDHENTSSYNHSSIKEECKDTKVMESGNVFDLNQNNAGEKKGNQIQCKIRKVQVDKIDGELTKRQLRSARKKRKILPVENFVSDENHNEKRLNLLNNQATSHLTVPAKKDQATERYPSLEGDSVGKCKEDEHSSSLVRRGMRPRKFSKETQIKSIRKKKVEASAPCPNPASVKSKNSPSQKGQGKRPRKFYKETLKKSRKRNQGKTAAPCPSPLSVVSKGKNSESQKRVKKSSDELHTSMDVNRSLSEVFTFSDDEDKGENLYSADENYRDLCSADKTTCRKSLDPLLKDCSPPSTEEDRTNCAKGNAASDYIEIDKDNEIDNDYDAYSKNNSLKVKSFDNEDCSPEIITEMESNLTVAPLHSENESKKSLKKFTTTVCEKYSNDEKKVEDSQILKINHEESVLAGIDAVKKKRISLAPRNKETVLSNQYISSIMPTEETQPYSMNFHSVDLENGGLSSLPTGVDIPEDTMKENPKDNVMSQLDTVKRKEVGNDNDFVDDIKLKLLPVVRYPEAVGSWHTSMHTIRMWGKIRKAKTRQDLKKPEPLHPEMSKSTDVNTTGASAMGCSKARSFFDLSDDDDLVIPSDGEEDHIESLPSTSKSFNLSKKFGVSLIKKSSKKGPDNSFKYKGRVVDIMKFL
ncbi:uncharacterized protein [Palaemon carinicauda]|uniref:uncharacterized protein n=1 Tax=Palaemon carinicauda TaxID=392227 RepID=UPI0035B58A78